MNAAVTRSFFWVLLATVSGSALAAPPVYRELKDFVVGCDNGGTCRALGIAREPSAEPLVLDLRRDAGAAGKVSARLSARSPFSPKDLRLDGKPVSALAALPWSDRSGEDGGSWILTQDEAVRRFLGLVRAGGRLEVGEGPDRAVLSLSGLSAALLLIDETQARLDTPGAWLRVGHRPTGSVPAPAVLPKLAAAKPAPPLPAARAAQLIAQVRQEQATRLRDCQEEPSANPDQAFALDATQALVLIGCGVGAYNTSQLGFLVPLGRGGSRPLSLRAPVAGPAGGTTIDLVNSGFDPATAALSHASKGRGLADCGESATWRFDGKVFQLADYTLLTRCGGLEPGDWITLWRTRS
jgi:hypothetical protein